MADFRAGGRFDRRRFVLTAAGTMGAGLAWPATTDATSNTVSPLSTRRRLRLPSPIPGGIELAPGVVIHVFGPGDPSVTLPFTGIVLQGLDHEPSTITNFKGSTAVAFHVGTARANDGTTYNLETDIRAFEGAYLSEGKVHRGSFALV
jgi:hypothetical protein